jgi:hypothetical protein
LTLFDDDSTIIPQSNKIYKIKYERLKNKMSNNTNKSNKNKQIYGYCRVSIKEQNLDRQLIAMREEGVP